MKIYVASSWRNKYQPEVVTALRANDNEVYDFRNPDDGDNGFHWSEIDKDWQSWSVDQYCNGLSHEVAERGYSKDYNAMVWADMCVLVLPCGRSAHLEAGWFVGSGKPLIIVIPPPERIEPELMYNMADVITDNYCEMISAVRNIDRCST